MKFDSEYFGKDWSRSKDENVRIFKKRHKLGLWAGICPMIFLVATVFANKRFKFLTEDQLFFGTFSLAFPAVLFIIFIYRCPTCGQTPYSSQNRAQGVLFFPKKCVRCKAPLLPDHPLGQK